MHRSTEHGGARVEMSSSTVITERPAGKQLGQWSTTAHVCTRIHPLHDERRARGNHDSLSPLFFQPGRNPIQSIRSKKCSGNGIVLRSHDASPLSPNFTNTAPLAGGGAQVHASKTAGIRDGLERPALTRGPNDPGPPPRAGMSLTCARPVLLPGTRRRAQLTNPHALVQRRRAWRAVNYRPSTAA